MTKQQPNLPVDSVTCPDGIKPVQGGTFECTAHLEGAQWPIGVTITNVDLGAENVTYDIKHTKALLIVEGIVESLKATARDQGFPNADVDCGTEPYRVVEFGGAIECTVTAGGSNRWCAPWTTVTVTVECTLRRTDPPPAARHTPGRRRSDGIDRLGATVGNPFSAPLAVPVAKLMPPAGIGEPPHRDGRLRPGSQRGLRTPSLAEPSPGGPRPPPPGPHPRRTTPAPAGA